MHVGRVSLGNTIPQSSSNYKNSPNFGKVDDKSKLYFYENPKKGWEKATFIERLFSGKKEKAVSYSIGILENLDAINIKMGKGGIPVATYDMDALREKAADYADNVGGTTVQLLRYPGQSPAKHAGAMDALKLYRLAEWYRYWVLDNANDVSSPEESNDSWKYDAH